MDAEKKALVFDVVCAGFAPAELDGWNALTGFSAWSEYLDACETIANDECSVLTDVLASGELMALRHPLGFEEVRAFAARHFTGGLPQSAVPVESLYRAGCRHTTASLPATWAISFLPWNSTCPNAWHPRPTMWR